MKKLEFELISRKEKEFFKNIGFGICDFAKSASNSMSGLYRKTPNVVKGIVVGGTLTAALIIGYQHLLAQPQKKEEKICVDYRVENAPLMSTKYHYGCFTANEFVKLRRDKYVTILSK